MNGILIGVLLLLLALPATGHAAAQKAAPSQLAVLQAQLTQATKEGDTARAVTLAEEIAEAIEPEHVAALYTAARLHARLGHREPAYRYLARAIGAGFWNREQLLEDDAFAEYRSDDLFKSMVRRAWARGYTNLLERSNRKEVQKTPEIMKVLAFKPGERVADIGAGSGYFTFPVAEAVGPTGIVYALDIAPEMLEYLDLRVKARQVTNSSSWFTGYGRLQNRAPDGGLAAGRLIGELRAGRVRLLQ